MYFLFFIFRLLNAQAELICNAKGCFKKCKTKGGIRRHKIAKHPEAVELEDAKFKADQIQQAADRHGPIYIKKYMRESLEKLSVDECYPEDFREQFKHVTIDSDDAIYIFQTMQQEILKFKGDKEGFLQKFKDEIICSGKRIAMKEKFADPRKFYLIMFELSSKCLAHLLNFGKVNNPENVMKQLSEKETGALQYLSGHVVHKIYVKLRKSNHWREEVFQEIINLVRSMKIEPNDQHKYVKTRDRGGLWYICSERIYFSGLKGILP